MPAALGVILEGKDLVVEEARSVCPRVGDQRLLLGEFQLEVVAQELAQSSLDLLGFGPWPGESQEEVG